ncbi:MAG: NAD(P)/FAD-dependent oxidoreductase [Geobacteraceae bacterium]|nr:NAD(P)/FAD-dependent oxidoreductase [Geobacteraceae bacterium]
MESCDVLVAGGGPAGSTCAGRLQQAGLDVLLLDSQIFPRQKPCAGWITPPVFDALALDADTYRQGRVLQDIENFRTGIIGGAPVVTRYGTTVSYGIRRCEFDHYLLQRCCVRRSLGEPVTTMVRHDSGWIVNGRIRTRLLVGAGGHFCPVARLLGARIGREAAVAAQVAEFALSPAEENMSSVPADTPALFFCRDMKGYGWLFRKGNYINVGLGRMDTTHLVQHTREFCTFLQHHGYLSADLDGRFQGHAYRVYQGQGGRNCIGDGALLIGDAAGVAHSHSGEGILPAIESAMMAADTIVSAKGDYRREKLKPYADSLTGRYGAGSEKVTPLHVPSLFLRMLGARLLSSKGFTRHIVLNRWFLHANQNMLNSKQH